MSLGKRWGNLNPYELHKTLINEYYLTSKGTASLLTRDTSKDKRDIDVIKENHQFLWDNDKDSDLTWEKKLAKKYFDKLYKEYCVSDLSRYKENKIGLRWRTEQELINGKGQFNCGSKKCEEKESLRTWEVNFSYVEQGIKKNALVKLRLCPNCSYKLNYHHKKKEVKRLKHDTVKSKGENSLLSLKDKKAYMKNQKEDEEKKDKESKESEFGGEISGIWKQSNVEEEMESKTRDQEFDEYLDQLFL